MLVLPALLVASLFPWIWEWFARPAWIWDIASYDLHRSFQLIALCFVCLIPLSFRSATRVPDALKNRALLLFGIFLLGAISALSSLRPFIAILEVSVWLTLCLLAVGIARWRSGQPDVDRWLILFFLAAVVGNTLTFFDEYLSALIFNSFVSDAKMFPGYGNIRVFNHIQTLLIPACLFADRCMPRGRYYYVLFIVISALWMSLAIITGARATLLAVVVSALICGVAFGVQGRAYLSRLTVFLVAGFLMWLVLYGLLPWALHGEMAFSYPMLRSGLSTRDVLWNKAFDLAMAHPWIGVGPMHFASYPNPVASGPHNFLLQLLSEWGVPATLLFFSFIVLLIFKQYVCTRNAVRQERKDAWLDIVIFATILAWLVDSLFSDSMTMPGPQLWLAVLLGWSWGRNYDLLDSTTGVSLGGVLRWTLITGCAAVAALFISLVSVLPQNLSSIYKSQRIYLQDIPKYRHFSYRFWRQGWIVSGTWWDGAATGYDNELVE
ncbi:O-antigen ligase family protein [Chitinimonas taiwanensis]|uniref:O-antigen ligase family protein n=1 Tax=Chitinimonas taiwanensis TaxID=240412 RepID=UPI0015873D9B|nr:O-antigen ligase family protein [Chitinimonas taiwanensis]